MPKPAHDKLPPVVAEYLADTQGLGIRQGIVMERLASAPCSINAFSRSIARLQSHPGYYGCILSGVIPEIVIADAAVLAAAVDHHATRSACREIPETIREVSLMADQLCDLLEKIERACLNAGLTGEQINNLAAAIPKAIEHCGDIAELAYAAANEAPGHILPEQDWAVTVRKWSDIAAFVAFADDRIANEAHLLPGGFRLTNPEMAGLAWAATGQKDLSPVINRGEIVTTQVGRNSVAIPGLREGSGSR